MGGSRPFVSVSSLGNAALNGAVARWPKETIWVNEMNGSSPGAVQATELAAAEAWTDSVLRWTFSVILSAGAKWAIYGAQLERSELLPVETPVTIVVDQVELCASTIWAEGEKCGVLLSSCISIQSASRPGRAADRNGKAASTDWRSLKGWASRCAVAIRSACAGNRLSGWDNAHQGAAHRNSSSSAP